MSSCWPARSCARTAPGSSARASTAPTSSTSTRWPPRTACRATPSSGSRSKARSTTIRPAARATSGCSASCGWCPPSRRGRACSLEIGPAPGGRPRAPRAGGGPGTRARRLREALYEVESAAPREDAERLLRSFLKRAYRRPVAEDDVQRFLALFERPVQEGLRLRPVPALGLHGRPGVAGLRVRRGEAGPARRPRTGHAAVAVPVELDPRRHPARPGRPRRTEQARTCCAPRPSGCSTIPKHAASSRRSPTTGSTSGRSTTPRRPPRSTTITSWTTR